MDLCYKFKEHTIAKVLGEKIDKEGQFLLDMLTFLEENYDIHEEPQHSCLGLRDMQGKCVVCGEITI